MAKYLATKGDSFGRNEHTNGLMRLPDYHWLKSAAKESLRTQKLNGHALTKGVIVWAYQLSLDQLNPIND